MDGLLLDVSQERGRSILRFYIRTRNGIVVAKKKYLPYFYALGDLEKARRIVESRGAIKTEIEEVLVGREKKKALKIFVSLPSEMQKLKEILEAYGIDVREHHFSLVKRFLLDHDLAPMEGIEFEVKGDVLEKIEKKPETKIPFVVAAFDIEVLAKDRAPDPERDPVIFISYVDSEGREKVFTFKTGLKGDKIVSCRDESEMIRKFVEEVRRNEVDVLMGYNSDNFDLPYLRERARRLGIKLSLGRDGSEPSIRRTRGEEERTVVDIEGRMHVDVLRIMQFLAKLGALDLFKFDLKTVYRKIVGKEPLEMDMKEIFESWHNGDARKIADYCLSDAKATYELGTRFLDLFIELCRLTKENLYEVTRSSPSQIVEAKLIDEAKKAGKLIPRMPKEAEVRARLATTYKGGFVKEPVPGLHENIVVCDFRSLYPSIIIAHNVDPDTLDCECCKNDGHIAPTGHWFCKKKEGLIPKMLREILTERFRIKKEMKKYPKDSEEYRVLYAKQWALKIIANSTYGYMGYARSRWYCKECAEAITAWGRSYIKDVMKKAEEAGFEVIYGDTDSLFLKLNGKTKEDVVRFVEKINSELPEAMELEIQGFYVRGIFLMKKGEDVAAKKRYALMDEKGGLKITGLEAVRRDWAEIAKETQTKVLELVLGKGDVKGALEYVRKVIRDLREKKVPLEKLVIYTQIQKPLDAYVSAGPHVVAARKAVARGKKIGVGSLIGYVITDRGGKISDKAELVEFVKEGEYDPEYYIKNQVVPAVISIFEALGYDEKALTSGGQTTLFDFA